MKLVAAIVQDEDAGGLVDALVARGFGVTRINTAGGFLRASNATILSGIAEERLDEALAIVEKSCQTRTRLLNLLPSAFDPNAFYLPEPVEVQVGGATVFLLEVEEVAYL